MQYMQFVPLLVVGNQASLLVSINVLNVSRHDSSINDGNHHAYKCLSSATRSNLLRLESGCPGQMRLSRDRNFNLKTVDRSPLKLSCAHEIGRVSGVDSIRLKAAGRD
jgi:hypothetical protein